MENEVAAMTRAWFDQVWNEKREEAIEKYLADEAVFHGLTDERGEELRGPNGFRPFFRMFCQAIPDLHVQVVDIICEGEKVAARCVARGTHRGDGLGVPATGNRIEFAGMVMARVQAGRIVEGWNQWDFATLQQQMRYCQKLWMTS